MTIENNDTPGFPPARKPSALYTWELGANYGHLGRFLSVAPALRDRGYEVHCAVSNTESAARLLFPRGFSWLPAPAVTERRLASPPLSYPDILARFGFGDEYELLGLVGAWRELIRGCDASIILADHAPVSILAARSLGLPVMLFSSGFTVPPLCSPMPVLRPWQPIPESKLLEVELRVLSVINSVLARFGCDPLPALWHLFDVAERALMTFPELDHYENRGPSTYWGNMPDSSIGVAPEWPQGPGKRVFAYLRRETPQLEAILNALRRLTSPTLVYFPGFPEEDRKRFQTPMLRFLTEPADLGKMSREADAAVTYASLATTTVFLMQGKPLLLLPSHMEQFLLARRVVNMGAGILVNPESPPGNMDGLVRALIDNPQFGENARLFAAKYATFPQDQVVGNLMRRIDEICGGAGV